VDEDHLSRLDSVPGDDGLQRFEQLVDGGIAIDVDLDRPALAVGLVQIGLDLFRVWNGRIALVAGLLAIGRDQVSDGPPGRAALRRAVERDLEAGEAVVVGIAVLKPLSSSARPV